MKLSTGVCLSLAIAERAGHGCVRRFGSHAAHGSGPQPLRRLPPLSLPHPRWGPARLAPMPDCGLTTDCCEEGGNRLFKAEISGAQAAVRESRPEWFRPNGSLKVSDVVYTGEVAPEGNGALRAVRPRWRPVQPAPRAARSPRMRWASSATTACPRTRTSWSARRTHREPSSTPPAGQPRSDVDRASCWGWAGTRAWRRAIGYLQ